MVNIKKEKIPNPAKSDIYEKFDTCSSTECTGLITVPPADEAELENYMDVYDFGPPLTESHRRKP